MQPALRGEGERLRDRRARRRQAPRAAGPGRRGRLVSASSPLRRGMLCSLSCLSPKQAVHAHLACALESSPWSMHAAHVLRRAVTDIAIGSLFAGLKHCARVTAR